LNGSFFLKPPGAGQTVFDDLSRDTATGGNGNDWFLLNRTAPGTLDSSDRAGSETGTDL